MVPPPHLYRVYKLLVQNWEAKMRYALAHSCLKLLYPARFVLRDRFPPARLTVRITVAF